MIMILKSSKTITEIKKDLKGAAVYNLSYNDYLRKMEYIKTNVTKCVPKCAIFNLSNY